GGHVCRPRHQVESVGRVGVARLDQVMGVDRVINSEGLVFGHYMAPLAPVRYRLISSASDNTRSHTATSPTSPMKGRLFAGPEARKAVSTPNAVLTVAVAFVSLHHKVTLLSSRVAATNCHWLRMCGVEARLP